MAFVMRMVRNNIWLLSVRDVNKIYFRKHDTIPSDFKWKPNWRDMHLCHSYLLHLQHTHIYYQNKIQQNNAIMMRKICCLSTKFMYYANKTMIPTTKLNTSVEYICFGQRRHATFGGADEYFKRPFAILLQRLILFYSLTIIIIIISRRRKVVIWSQ